MNGRLDESGSPGIVILLPVISLAGKVGHKIAWFRKVVSSIYVSNIEGELFRVTAPKANIRLVRYHVPSQTN